MAKEVIPCIFYLYIFKKIRDRKGDNYISKKEIISHMHEWRIPKKIRRLMLKELEILGLTEKVDKNTLKMLDCEFKEEDLNKYYEELGIF
jgi:hypothetical protein